MFISLITILVVAVLAAIIAFGSIVAKKEEQETYENGIETYGFVVDNSLVKKTIVDGDVYVNYFDDTNTERIGRLNVDANLPLGKKIKIKFLPGSYDEVVFVADMLE